MIFLPVPTGPLKGFKLSLGTSVRCFKGTFEQAKAEFIEAAVEKGETAWDIGAHVGYMTLVIAKNVGPDGHVYAFEPNKTNFHIARHHVKANVANVDILPVGLWSSSGVEHFSLDHKSLAGQIVTSGGGGGMVAVLSIEDILRSGIPMPTFVKMDAEGAEMKLMPALLSQVPTEPLCFLVSIDSEEALAQAHELAAEHKMALHLCAKFRHPDPYSLFGDAEVLFVGSGRRCEQSVLDRFLAIGSKPMK